MHWVTPIAEQVADVNVRTVKIEKATLAYSKDIQTVETKIALNYHVNPDKVAILYQEVKNDYENVIINPGVEEAVKSATAKFTAQELIEQRPLVKEEIKATLLARLEKYFIVDDFSITDFSFSDSFEAAIEAKQVAQQDALKAENELRRIEVEAKQTIEKAKAEAESIRIQGEALKQNQDLVSLKAVERWDGKLPAYMLGDSVPFLNLK